MNTILHRIDELSQRAKNPTNHLKRIKKEKISERMIDGLIMQAIREGNRTVRAVSKRLSLTEKQLLDNLNPELFCQSQLSENNIALGFTPKALGL